MADIITIMSLDLPPSTQVSYDLPMPSHQTYPQAHQQKIAFAPRLPATASQMHQARNRLNSMILESQLDQRPRINVKTLPGRPGVGAIVKGVVKAAEERDLVAVAAYGPMESELIRVTRNAVANSIELGGASVTLHCEQFG